MKELLDNITKMFSKNKYNDLANAVDEKKLLYLYAFYHYFYGDEDYLIDVIEGCDYKKTMNNYAQGFFEEENYENNVLDLIIPYFVEEGDQFNFGLVKNMIVQTIALIGQIKNKNFNITANESMLREIWDPQSDTKLLIKVITNYVPNFDDRNDIRDEINNMVSMYDELSFEIVFGDEIEDEITQLTSDKKCVESGELVLDRPNNFLTYGDEGSIITNIKATSLKENFNKYGKAGLFAMNLRFYVVNKKVDEGLELSIREKGENFWYYNNGIIIVCDDYEIVDDKLKLKNYSIVNGGQTTRMIGVIPFNKDFAISCKVIKNKYEDRVENAKFVAEIAEASNTQKPINSTDIIANRYEQRVFKQRFADNDIFMQIKRGDAAAANLKENYPAPWQKIKNDELAQLLYGSLYQKPGTARNAKAKIFSDMNKYELVFGDLNYDMGFLKDLLFIKAYYKKWATKVNGDENADNTKKGLVKNGYLFFAASIVLMAKLIFSTTLVEYLKNVNINTEKGNYVASRKTFNHRIFNDDYDALQNRMYALFDLVYDRYISRAFLKAKEIKPELVYSNFTKTDKNYTTSIACDIFDDFAYQLNGRVISVINPLFYKPNESENRESDELLQEAIQQYENKPVEEDEPVDIIADELRDRLSEYRTQTYKKEGVKAYEVFTNKELEALVTLKPKTTFELMQYGCFKNHPRTKAKKYGQDIVNIIADVCGEKHA